MHTDIASSSLRELDAVALPTNVMLFLGRDTNMLTELQGQIERITYTNEENRFTIAKVKVPGQRGLATVVGNLMALTPGEVLTMKGEWTHHPRYGKQFKISHFKSQVPASVYGIRKYLVSGLMLCSLAMSESQEAPIRISSSGVVGSNPSDFFIPTRWKDRE